MKNIPRIYINEKIIVGKKIPAGSDTAHYLTKVMRTNDCLIFSAGDEFNATLSPDAKYFDVIKQTERADPSNDWTLLFAPIKRMEELLSMATQMGVRFLQPVITDRTNAHYVKFSRAEKLLISASEQSGRNSVPVILPTIKFAELDKENLIFADERSVNKPATKTEITQNIRRVFVGPEGGFSDAEFFALDAAGAVPVSLGRTILRAETAAAVAMARVML